MELSFIIGFLVGLLVIATICFLIIKFNKRNYKNKYDERQKAIQGVAYKFGFFAMFAYFFINGFVCEFTGNWLPMLEMNFIGLCVGIACYAGYAIFNDAYISLYTRPLQLVISLAIISIANYFIFFVNLNDNGDAYLNLICSVLLTVICIMLIIKIIIDKRKAKKELVEE